MSLSHVPLVIVASFDLYFGWLFANQSLRTNFGLLDLLLNILRFSFKNADSAVFHFNLCRFFFWLFFNAIEIKAIFRGFSLNKKKLVLFTFWLIQSTMFEYFLNETDFWLQVENKDCTINKNSDLGQLKSNNWHCSLSILYEGEHSMKAMRKDIQYES